MNQPLALTPKYQIRIRSAGRGSIIPHKHTRWVSHCTYLMTRFKTERLKLTTERGQWLCRDRCVMLIQPGERLKIEYYQPGDLDWVHFTVVNQRGHRIMDQWTDYSLDLPDRRSLCQPDSERVWGVQLPVLMPGNLMHETQTTVEKVTTLWHHRPPYSRIDAQGLLASLLHRWVLEERQIIEQQTLDEVERKLLNAENHVRQHISSYLGVDQMAEVAGYERSHFSVLYRQRRQYSPGHYIKTVKMEHAALLLRTQDLPVKLVSQMVGYPKESSFCRAFRQWFDQSPGEYHAEHWTQHRAL